MKPEEPFTTLELQGDKLILLDQRKLPLEESYYTCESYQDTAFAISDMVVRGAPAIGAAAAYGLYMAALEFSHTGVQPFLEHLAHARDYLEKARPTAVNLRWALRRMYKVAEAQQYSMQDELLSHLKQTADTICREDVAINRTIARHGNEVIPQKASILTHCNTGALATAGWGTALGVIKEAAASGKDMFVYADETRPRLQGARLTAWELLKAEIPFQLLSDSAAATLIRDGKVDCVILGGDRVAANGDVCNKIGTFMLSVICKEYGVPFYSVIPVSTIDFEAPTGAHIPIEMRDSREVTHIGDVQIAPDGIDVYNPAFDVTPHQNITGIITEEGILRPPYHEAIARLQKQYEKI